MGAPYFIRQLPMGYFPPSLFCARERLDGRKWHPYLADDKGKGKGKGKVRPRTSHEGPEGE